MDAFRILSRSTNASRKPANPVTQTLEASAGYASKPDLVLSRTDRSSPVTQPAKKRKREVKDTDTIIPPQLDFFRTSLDVESHVSAQVTSETSGLEDEDSQSQEVKRKHVEEDVLPEEECRRILRQHKLKITRLDSLAEQEEEPDDSAKTKKKRKRQKEEVEMAKESKKGKKHKVDVVPQPLIDFEQLRTRYQIQSKLAANLREHGYLKSTEVQMAALSLLLGNSTMIPGMSTGKSKKKAAEQNTHSIGVDLLSVAPTGSGKTLAFLIPVLNALASGSLANEDNEKSSSDPRAIIVAPTKELAVQIVHETRKLAKFLPITAAIAKKTMALGATVGEPMAGIEQADEDDGSEDEHVVSESQQKRVSIPDILVSTPLTLVNAMTAENGTLRPLPNVKYLILDEADVLLDPVFRVQTLKIWNNCNNPNLRVSLWSATMGASIEDLAQSTINSRFKSLVTSSSIRISRTPLLRLVVGLKDSAIPHIHHRLTYCGTEAGKLLALRQLLRPSNPTSTSTPNDPPLRPPFLVFTQTIPRAKALHTELLYDIPASAGGSERIAVLHADLPSAARAAIMGRVRRGEIWVLITTDLLSRGVDFKGINGVVNYDFPNSSAAYVHRVGRTGRAGRQGGVAVTLYAKEDVPFVKNVANVISASQRAKGAVGSDGAVEGGLAPWLLKALPKPSKRDRQKLKKRGIEERRPDAVNKGAKTRIETMSGFEKRMEERRRGAVQGSKRRAVQQGVNAEGDDDDVFEGLD